MKTINTWGIVRLVISLIILVGGISVAIFYYIDYTKLKSIDSYDKCVAAGGAILEKFPEQCQTSDNRFFTKDYSNISITVTGKVVCLPHKNANGPQTLECAYGIQEDSTGKYYALSDPDLKFITTLPMNTQVTITGQFGSDNSSNYDIVGKIEMTNVVGK